MKRLFHNSNGSDYCLIKGCKNNKAILVNMDTEQYIVCSVLLEDRWLFGNYFCCLENALDFYHDGECQNRL